MTDIISAIDQATGCHQCGNPLGSSPSSDFCSEFCQATWHEKRVSMAKLTSRLDLHQQAREGERITVQPPSGAAQEYIFMSGRWERVGAAQPTTSFATPTDFRAAVGGILGELSRMRGVPRELLGFNVVVSDQVDPPNSVHIRGDGTSYVL